MILSNASPLIARSFESSQYSAIYRRDLNGTDIVGIIIAIVAAIAAVLGLFKGWKCWRKGSQGLVRNSFLFPESMMSNSARIGCLHLSVSWGMALTGLTPTVGYKNQGSRDAVEMVPIPQLSTNLEVSQNNEDIDSNARTIHNTTITNNISMYLHHAHTTHEPGSWVGGSEDLEVGLAGRRNRVLTL